MSSIFRTPPLPPIEDIIFFLQTFFIADLAYVGHDQDFKLNLFFSSWKVHQYLEKVPDKPDPPHEWTIFLCVYFVFQSFLIIFYKKNNNWGHPGGQTPPPLNWGHVLNFFWLDP